MNRRSVLLLIGAVVSLGAAPLAARAAVPPLVDRAAAMLGAIARSIPKRAPRSTPQIITAPDRRKVLRESSRRPAPPRQSKPARPASDKPSGGILVRRDVVRAAVKRGVRPSATPVAATGDRPAGLTVYGWGAAGAGLADGDIITRVGGRTPSSVDDVVIAVAGAYKTKSHVVSGRIWRRGRVLAVTVELPLPKPDQGNQCGSLHPVHGSASRSTGGP